MKIKKISCDHFAGLRSADVSLSDGLNVVYGKNESGKSTLVSLLSAVLFRDARVTAKSKKDVEFATAFCPVKKDGTVASSLDGKVIFETEQGEFSLSKEWRVGKDGSVKLSTEDESFDEEEVARDLCRKELIYGPAVYTELLFSPQRAADEVLCAILDGGADSSAELTSILTSAFGAGGGASVDVIEKALEEKIAEIAGTHWDIAAGAPVRRARYQNGLGVILKAYYEVEDAEGDLGKLEALEGAVEKAKIELRYGEKALADARRSREEFREVVDLLKERENTKTILEQYEKEMTSYREALRVWPLAKAEGDRAAGLALERKNRKLLDQFEKAKELDEVCTRIRGELDAMLCPTDGEIRLVERLEREILQQKNLLCGMNLSAVLRTFEGHRASITSLRTGEEVKIENDKATLSEAVKIVIPGVMEMELAPASVDVKEVSARVEELEKEISEIFGKYGVTSIEELRGAAAFYKEKEDFWKNAKQSLALSLNGTCMEEMAQAVAEIAVMPRETEVIEGEILALCRSEAPDVFAAKRQAIVSGYEERYGSAEHLRTMLDKVCAKYEETKKSQVSEERIPVEYRGVDPTRKMGELDRIVEKSEEEVSKKIAAKSAAEQDLKNFLENLGDEDPEEKLREKKRLFASAKEELSHWVHIKEVFLQEKENLDGNPMLGLAKNFTRYLEMITGGTARGEMPSRERVDVEILSKDRPMNFAKLSEGTKETVSLAFRLAVLDELFPEGGGVICFDDPFTDMDDIRTARSCEMILDCAKRHQVIFLTCREEYVNMLKGNVISL